ncbi:MAG: isoprenyl transferase [Thermodesulfobacteriota bacterium]
MGDRPPARTSPALTFRETLKTPSQQTKMTDMDPDKIPQHVAVIMDGNGRWAKQKGLRRVLGHEKGADAVRDVVTTSREIGVRWLTLYAFSEENWKRPEHEIQALMRLLHRFLKKELDEMQKNGIRLNTIGRTEKLPAATRQILLDTMEKTQANHHMVLTLALSYGGRQEITDAVQEIARRVSRHELDSSDISETLISNTLYTREMPDPDLLIRTSGEYRISNFLLWQLSYTELYITSTLWPDFSKEEYLRAISEYQQRDRRFGTAGTRQ